MARKNQTIDASTGAEIPADDKTRTDNGKVHVVDGTELQRDNHSRVTNRRKNNKNHRCSCCGRKGSEVPLLFHGEHDESIYICSDCVNGLYELNQSIHLTQTGEIQWDRSLNESDTDMSLGKESGHIPTPREIVEYLDQHIIGQDVAKRDIAVQIYNHLKLISIPKEKRDKDEVKLHSSACTLIGSSGSGKTEIFRKLSEFLDIPLLIFDASRLTAAGFVGEDVESILIRAIQKCDNNVEKAQKMIILLDEADKLSRNDFYSKNDRGGFKSNINSSAVQHQLLSYIEGSEVSVQLGAGPGQERLVTFDTSNILWVISGAFVGIDEIIKSRLNRKPSVGFNLKDAGKSTEDIEKKKVEEENLIEYVTPHDVIEYGFAPELVGRCGAVTYTLPLSDEALRRVLTEPKSSVIKEYQKMLALDGKSLEFTDDAFDYIIKEAKKNETGARGLRAAVSKVMSKVMFESPDSKEKNIVIDMDYIQKNVEIPEEEQQKLKNKA